MAPRFLQPFLSLQVHLDETESLKVTLLLSFEPHSVAGLFSDKGPRGKCGAL